MQKLFDEIPYLENEFVILRKIGIADAALISRMSDNAHVRRYLPTFLFEYGFADKRDAVTQMYEDIFRRKESLHLAICLKQTREMAGIAELYNYDANWNKVSIGYRLDEPYWHQGIATHAVDLLVHYLLEETDVKRITAHVMAENLPSNRILADYGFRMRRKEVREDWGMEEPAIVNKYILEKWGNISYVKIGDGPKPMVMLPGLSLKSTLGAASSISKNYRMFGDYTIYLFDDRDHIGENYTMEERAGDVAAEMMTLGIHDAYVFGASMGGMVGLCLAKDHPQLVKKLFVSSTCARLADQTRNVVDTWKELALAGNFDRLVNDSIDMIYSEAIVAKYGDVLKQGVGEVTKEDLAQFVHLLDAIGRYDIYAELSKITCPVYVVSAEGDRIIPQSAVAELTDNLPCRIYTYGPEYGHGVYDEAPDHADRILTFFNT